MEVEVKTKTNPRQYRSCFHCEESRSFEVTDDCMSCDTCGLLMPSDYTDAEVVDES